MLRYLRRLADARLRARPHDDPARLVHHEAQRDGRDGADHLARSSPTSTRSRRPSRPRATRELIADLERWLAEITGYDAVSLQPNAGSQGEFAGLLAIRGVPPRRGDDARATSASSPPRRTAPTPRRAVMAGMRVVVVATDADGDVDLDDLQAKIDRARATRWPR